MRNKLSGGIAVVSFVALGGVLIACGASVSHREGRESQPDAEFARDDGAAPTDTGVSSADVAFPTVDAGLRADAVMPCSVQAPTMCPIPAPHYGDVSSIFGQRCTSCHNGIAGGPWSLLDYEHISDWRDSVRDELLNCSMPPADAGVMMPDSERLAILIWIRCGLPQ